jgi:hypothetical protein
MEAPLGSYLFPTLKIVDASNVWRIVVSEVAERPCSATSTYLVVVTVLTAAF